ncbi:nuclear GTP-binding protein nug1 [Vanrija albida]|uniref:Nuclear GTP-binding protein nug1 n=1 Tax=Vanrija albida TaxID=181172 RepID=A0ABR3Q7C4_9TREE
MPKANKKAGGKGKVYTLPTAQRSSKAGGVPKLQALKDKRQQTSPYTKAKPVAPTIGAKSMTALASTSNHLGNTYDATVHVAEDGTPIDASLTVRDSSAKAFMRELRKVIERADVIIQVLDARDPDGTRSKWVEEEVRKRDQQGKKLLAVVNKIDLVPRENLESWLKHLRHSFPTMPFKSSTQNQRVNLAQNNTQLAVEATIPGQKATRLAELPQTSSSLGAPALLNLLKQYALSTPHSALTVGVVGYPNVGKSSLINSLKRSRACGVAAMPGKTRVVQEVVLDKGVKILDCPGVVLEDIGREFEGEFGRRKQAEIMLRNAIKAELVEDPTAPIEVILDRADPAQLQKLYSIPAYSDVRDFLIKIALTRGRLGKGGIPDLEASAVQVLRDWNSGKISYFSRPPAVHPSNAKEVVVEGAEEDIAMDGERVGDAKILTALSEAFTLDGLFDNLGDEAEWQGGDDEEEDITETAVPVVSRPVPVAAPAPSAPASSRFDRAFAANIDSDDDMGSEPEDEPDSPVLRPMPTPRFPAPQQQAIAAAYMPAPAQRVADPARLFTSAELAHAPALDRARQKAAAKKAKKRQAIAEKTEAELLGGFIGMDMDNGAMYNDDAAPTIKTAKQKREDKKAAAKARAQAAQSARAPAAEMELEGGAETKKEADFASFLASMGAEDSDEEL